MVVLEAIDEDMLISMVAVVRGIGREDLKREMRRLWG